MDVTTQIVSGHNDAALDEELSQYWIDNAIGVPTKLAAQRLREVFAIARDETGQLIGVATVKVIWVQRLRNWFHSFRVSVAKNARGKVLGGDPHRWVDAKLFYSVLNHLEGAFEPSSVDSPIGFYVNVSNQKRNAVLNTPIERRTGLIFSGYNVDGEQIHIKYYPGARIDLASPPKLGKLKDG